MISAPLVPTSIKGRSYAPAVGDLVLVDATFASPVISLPKNAALGDQVAVRLIAVGGANTVIVLGGSTTIGTLKVKDETKTYQSNGDESWLVISGDLSLTQLDARYSTGINVKSAPYNCLGNNTTDDYAGIQAAINACPAGGIVFFPPGQYRVTQTLVLPANITLLGTDGYRYEQFTGTPVYIKPYFGNFTGTALISVTESDGWQLRNLALIGVGATAIGGGNIHGLLSTGFVKGAKIVDLEITNFTGDGIHTDTSSTGQPGGWEVSRLYSSNNNGYGWYSADPASKGISFTDSKIFQSECSVNATGGWRWDGCPTNEFVGLWAAFNSGGDGFYLNGNGSNCQFTACQTDRNARNGWYYKYSETVTTRPAPHTLTLTGCIANRDGRNGNAGQGGYAGLRVEGTSSGNPAGLVTLNGFSTHVNLDDAGTGQLSPDYGIYATSASLILLSGGAIQGTVASVFDDNNALNDSGNVEHSTVNFGTGAVTVLGLLGGSPAPRPSDYGYYSWAYDPVTATGSGTPTAGVVYLQRVPIRSPRNLSKCIYIFPTITSMNLTSGQCFVAIFGPDGTRLALSGDISALVTANEIAFSLLTSPNATPPWVWSAILLNGSVLPTLARGPALGGQGQSQVAATAARFGTYGTTQTSMPSSLTVGSIAKGTAYCAAVV